MICFVSSSAKIGKPPFTSAVSATQWRYCPSELFASTQALRASTKSVWKAPFIYGGVFRDHEYPEPSNAELLI